MKLTLFFCCSWVGSLNRVLFQGIDSCGVEHLQHLHGLRDLSFIISSQDFTCFNDIAPRSGVNLKGFF